MTIYIMQNRQEIVDKMSLMYRYDLVDPDERMGKNIQRIRNKIEMIMFSTRFNKNLQVYPGFQTSVEELIELSVEIYDAIMRLNEDEEGD